MTNTRNHAKYDSHLSICPRNYFSPLTWLSSLLQLLSDEYFVSLHLWGRMSEMKCSAPAQKEIKKSIYLQSWECHQRCVHSTTRLDNSVLKCGSQQQAATVCIGNICIRTQKNSPGVQVLSPLTSTGPVFGVCAKAGLRVGAKLLIATEVGSLEETVFVLAPSAPSAGNN